MSDRVPATVQTATGLRLEYLRQGPEHEMPILLLHGFTDSCRSFERLLTALPPHVHAIAMSLRGHGGSDRPRGPYDPATMATDVAGLLDCLGIDRAILAAHCMGGLAAQAFALDFPDRTAGLILIDSFPTMRGNTGVAELWTEIETLPDGVVDPGFVRAFQQSGIAKPVPSPFLDMVVSESLRLPAWRWRAVLSAVKDCDFTGALNRIDAPAQIIWGDRDPVFGRDCQDALLAGLPGAMLHIMPGLGHSPHWEDPGAVAALICEHALRCIRNATHPEFEEAEPCL